MYVYFIRPVWGWIIALVFFIILLPLLFMITIVLAIQNQGKVFFFQKRPGLNEKPFLLLKFRTLLDTTDETGLLLPDYQRQFAFGSFLRHYHLDELPQFINVLRGDLNFIGPRPLLVEYLPYYSQLQKTRHNIRPGIIGLSQVMGGNKLNWAQRLRLDVFYVKHQSFSLDVQIVWLTIKYFFQKKRKPDEDSIFSGESFVDYMGKN
jgi:undecaprenyl phosphate N,N'-diacetylbacillosamine 1-phosphate transferase